MNTIALRRAAVTGRAATRSMRFYTAGATGATRQDGSTDAFNVSCPQRHSCVVLENGILTIAVET